MTSCGHPALLHKGQFVDLGDVHTSSPLPPLADRNVRYTDAMRERASREEDVRAAVEEYCASNNPFKELTITK